jgi:hypothetical protein
MIERNIRRTQLTGPWGIGHMIDFPNDESLVVAGQDAWDRVYNMAQDSMHEFIVNDQRLQKRLGVNHFRIPPDYRSPEMQTKNPGLEIPFLRFPLWHYCPWCHCMKKIMPYQPGQLKCPAPDYEKGRTCKKNKYPSQMIPVRFVTACEKGHLDDFPFLEWAHGEDNEINSSCSLRWSEGNTPELYDIWIECDCGEKKSMAGSFNKNSLENIKKCSGKRVWLGEFDEDPEKCGKNLWTLQKGATNVYFPLTKSSIFLPQKVLTEDYSNIIRENPTLTSLLNGELNYEIIKVIAGQKNIEYKKLLFYLKKEIGMGELSDEEYEIDEIREDDFRLAEYDTIIKGTTNNSDELDIMTKSLDEYSTIIKACFSNIRLIHRLKETRALYGFARVTYDPGDIASKKNLLSVKRKNWLPAVWYKGEGIFIEFSDELTNQWAEKYGSNKRCLPIIQRYNEFRSTEFDLDEKFILIHSFAHMMINELIYQCGYGSSSLRERIYYKPGEMSGVMIYTASGDSEGSMGGLVRLGYPGKLESIITLAIEKTQWCSSDPICINSEGQGPDSCNLAACHNCLLLPETSCEFGNRLLDRALLTGHPDEDLTGYFSSIYFQGG